MYNELFYNCALDFFKNLSGTVFTRAEIDTSQQQSVSPDPQVFYFIKQELSPDRAALPDYGPTTARWGQGDMASTQQRLQHQAP